MTKIPKPILPNFLLAGAAKCGMSSVYYALKQHPDVFVSTPKEPDFFFAQFSKIPTNGIGDDCYNIVQKKDEYYRLFENAAGKKAIGEASHTNLYHHRKTIPLIKHYLGDPKIIIILRNPVERAFAAYSELVLEGREFLSFEEALRQEPERIAEGWRPTWYYQDLGFYACQVKAYYDYFSMIKVCLFDDLKRDPVSLVKDIYRFLKVDDTFIPDMTADYNISGVPKSTLFKSLFRRKPPLQNVVSFLGKTIFTEDGWARVREKLKAKLLAKNAIMKPETRHNLKNLYRADIMKLQDCLDRDLSSWL
jgi:hypothetical protein